MNICLFFSSSALTVVHVYFQVQLVGGFLPSEIFATSHGQVVTGVVPSTPWYRVICYRALGLALPCPSMIIMLAKVQVSYLIKFKTQGVNC